MPAHPGLQQNEFAIARHHVIDHLAVAVAGLEPLAHQQAQIARQRRLGIVDRLILADHAAQVVRDRTGAGLQRRIGQNFVHLDGMERRRAEKRQQHQKKTNASRPFEIL